MIKNPQYYKCYVLWWHIFQKHREDSEAEEMAWLHTDSHETFKKDPPMIPNMVSGLTPHKI